MHQQTLIKSAGSFALRPLKRLLCLLVSLAFLLGTTGASAQDVTVEFFDLLLNKKRGFVAANQLLEKSFAAHLHSAGQVLDPENLSALGAAYDPESDTPLNAGMLYFHMALPIALLREMGGEGNAILADIIELRIRWLSGDPAHARAQAEALIARIEGLGAPDDQMVSLLADAAVLAWRGGDAEAALAFMARAQTCGIPRCPSDLVFEWLTSNPKPNETPYDGFDADKLRSRALAGLGDVDTNFGTMQAEIDAEWRFMTGKWVGALTDAIVQARRVDTGDLSQADRRNIRNLVDRMQSHNDLVPFLMEYNSVAAEFVGLLDVDGKLSAEKLRGSDLSYLGDDYLSSILMERLPILILLYRASDRPSDVIVARGMEARLVLSDNDPCRALLLLNEIIADARKLGFRDDQLFSILMDQWAAAVLSGSADVASAADTATAQCRQTECPEDLVRGLANRYTSLPETVFPPGYETTMRAAADAFIQSTFPDDFLKLADLYNTGSMASANRPIEDARDQITSFDFAMQVRDLTPKSLVKRATSTMEALIVAGLYRQALDIGDRAEARLLRDGTADNIDALFLQKRARAGFRMGEPRVGAFYDQAVALIMATPEKDRSRDLVNDLMLDLLDTGFDAPLLRLIGGDPAKGDTRARVFHRQGRHPEAVVEYSAYRRYMEVSLGQPREVLIAMFEARADLHLRGKNLDAYLSARQAGAALRAGQDVPQDHPLAYATNALLRAVALQDAYYHEAAGDFEGARRLNMLGNIPGWPSAWPDINDPPTPEVLAYFKENATGFATSTSPIRTILDFRDTGNYQGAAAAMRSMAWLAQSAELNGAYEDAQALWQMAFTFARGGETVIAFDLMERAAKNAVALSFKGASQGMLQVLERDRWRYLLFVDIAWAALTGQTPDEMLVVSRY